MSIGKTVDVLTAQQDKAFIQHPLIPSESVITDTGDVIVGVIPSDFDGDAEMDLLVMTKISNTARPVTLNIFWGEYDKQDKMPKLGTGLAFAIIYFI